MQRHPRFLVQFTAFLIGLLFCGAALAVDEIAIIVAKDGPDLHFDPTILRDIYLKKVFINEHGQSFIPVNLPPENSLRRAISDVVFKKSTQQLQNYWNQRYFLGITPPYVLQSQEAVMQFVAKTSGAIGYILSCQLDASVKQVLSISVPLSQHEEFEKLCPVQGDAKQSIPLE